MNSVKDPTDFGRIIKSGHNNGKIGRVVTKGAWKGFPIFTVTLEERATCPRSCLQWRSCFGNNMHLAERWRAGPDLEHYIVHEVVALQKNHPEGFAIRLHVLGDFYSRDYVLMWHALMDICPALHVFGFTARIDPDDEITKAIVEIRREFKSRWHIRFSGAVMPVLASEVVDMPEQASEGSIICPQQTDRTLTCGTCGLCWASNTNITFLRH